jgi:signal transduction histidine kinase
MDSTRTPGLPTSLLMAVLAVAISFLLRLWPLHVLVGERYPFFPYYPAAIIISIYFGWLAGVLTAILTCLVLIYRSSGSVEGRSWAAYAMFLGVSAATSAIIELLRRARDRERQRRLAQSNFVAMLAHEIKTPLAAIQMAAGSLARGLDSAAAEARLHNVNRAVEDIAAIVDRCMEADRIDQSVLKPQAEPVELKGLLTEILSSTMASDRIDFRCEDVLTISTDPLLLQRIMVNLVDNALKYSPSGSRIAVHAATERRKGREGVALVCGNSVGPAGAPDPREVFQKYYRAPEAQALSGAGLGLWLVKRIVGLLSGDIRFEAGNGRVSFTVWLPHSP